MTFAVGVLGAVAVARGSYASMLVGALLFQLNSILDGVDGELARVRFQESKLGEWIDTVSDDLCNVLFYVGMAIGAAGHGPWWLPLLGYGAAIAAAGTMVFYYAELVRLGRGDFYALSWDTGSPSGFGARVVAIFVLVLKKDLFIFLFVIAAALGVLPFTLPVVFAATLVTLGAGIVRTVRGGLARRRAAVE